MVAQRGGRAARRSAPPVATRPSPATSAIQSGRPVNGKFTPAAEPAGDCAAWDAPWTPPAALAGGVAAGVVVPCARCVTPFTPPPAAGVATVGSWATGAGAVTTGAGACVGTVSAGTATGAVAV